MIKIQEPSRPWEIVHMDWVTGLPPGGDRSYNAVLVIFGRFSKTPIFLPCHKDDTAMDTALLIWNTVSDRDPKFTSALWTNLHHLFGTKLSFSTAYHPQTDGLAERMIQTLEDMVSRFCVYGLELKDCDGFTHDWCNFSPALELEYKTSIHASTNQTPSILEKRWNPKLPWDSLRKDLVEIHPKAASSKGILYKARKHSVRCMEDSFEDAKDKWDKSHSTSDFKALHGENAIEVELSEELSNKNPTFPVILIKPYKSSDAEKFPLRNMVPQVIFLPYHKDDTAMDSALLIWNRVVSWTGIFTNIISDRDAKFTPALWTNFHNLFGTKLSLSTAYHPQTDGFAERMIQSLEDMVRRVCAYGLEFKDCDGLTHEWCTLLPELELAYKTSINASTNQTLAILEKGWNSKLPQDSLMKDLVEIQPTASSFKGILDKTEKHAISCMEESFAYSKDKWDKSHATPDFKALHGENAVEVELSEELSNKHPTFPVILIKPYKSSGAEKFPLRNIVPQVIPPIEPSGIKKITKVLKERNLRTNKVRGYLVRYSDPAYEYELLAEKDIPEATKPLIGFRHTINNNITK
ncbi:hypothetical protein O181_053541 [Austropuccinia psidii MF-1]|uniref:Integrase catalytic domain-containing protein n=1 Tax=Austropuccinia psidii MF-1 TaxID=1389203 RepID=A0A9Q3E0M8_9BASI|nr:hypothetical protein [Austropuccinia psidii MF-1]